MEEYEENGNQLSRYILTHHQGEWCKADHVEELEAALASLEADRNSWKRVARIREAEVERLKEMLDMHDVCQKCGSCFTSMNRSGKHGCECEEQEAGE